MEANDEKLKDSGYVISVDAYKERKVIKVSEKAEVKTLGEICDFGRGVHITKENLSGDRYLVIGGGEKPMGKCNEQNTEPETVMISRMGSAGFVSKFNQNVFATDKIIKLFPSTACNNDYLYYYCKYSMHDQLKTIIQGSAQPGLNASDLAKMQIPIPSLEKQEEIVELAKKLENQVNNYKTLIDGLQYEIEAIKQCSPFISEDTEMKTLEEICEIKNGKFQSNDMSESGNIPFYNCSANNPCGSHNESSFDYETNYILMITAGGSENNKYGDNVGLGKVYLVSGKTACRSGVYAIKNVDESIIITKYLFHYLNNNKNIIADLAVFTTSLGVIKQDSIKKIPIPIPPLEKQLELSKKYEKIDDKRNMLVGSMKEMKELMSTTLERLFTS
jgi:restriction endonuclease S subunit